MARIKGSSEWNRFKKGEKLTRKEAVLANCYQCNGYEDSRTDCGLGNCPLRPFSPHKNKILVDETEIEC